MKDREHLADVDVLGVDPLIYQIECLCGWSKISDKTGELWIWFTEHRNENAASVLQPSDVFCAQCGSATFDKKNPLLEPLEDMLAFFSPKPGQRVVIDCVVRAKAAVAKAKGEL